MVDDDVLARLHGVDDGLGVRVRELARELGRDEARGRLGHDEAVRARVAVRPGVGDDELRRLFQDGLDHRRVGDAGHHDLRHADQAARQRVRADDAGQHRPVGDALFGLLDGVDVDLRAAGAYLRHAQRLRVVERVDDGVAHRRDGVVVHLDARAEALRLDRQVHHAQRRQRGQAVGQDLHALGQRVAVAEELADVDAHQLDHREREDRDGLLDRVADDVLFPLQHVHSGKPSKRLMPSTVRYCSATV